MAQAATAPQENTEATPPDTKPKAAKVKEPEGLPKPGDTEKPVAKADKFFVGSLLPFRSELIRQHYTFTADDGVTLADVLKPEYWKNVTFHFEVDAHIAVKFTGDDARYVELLCVAKGALWAKFVPIINVKLDLSEEPAAQDDAGAFRVFHKGGGKAWVVERTSDKAILHENATTKKQAEDWLADYRKTIRR